MFYLSCFWQVSVQLIALFLFYKSLPIRQLIKNVNYSKVVYIILIQSQKYYAHNIFSKNIIEAAFGEFWEKVILNTSFSHLIQF